MNEKGREVLVKAAVDGVPQAYGTFVDDEKICAMQALHQAAAPRLACEAFDMPWEEHGACPECGKGGFTEPMLVIHLNDDHKFDFLTIARKMP